MKTRRALFVLTLVALLAAAVAAGNAQASKPAASHAARATSTGAAWYCPGLPPSLPAGDGRVTFANIGTTPSDVDVSVLADTGEPTHTTFTVPASSTVTKHRADIGPAGALTVETFGGRLVVEEGLDGKSGAESTPCAADAATSWSFAAGTTTRGVQQWLVIDDPFASDAKVNITLRTSSGLRKPDKLQSVDVSRRSRVVVPIHDQAVLEPRVAVTVDATLGRVVASQTLVFTSDSGAPGVATTVGTAAASDQTLFAEGTRATGANEWLALANVGGDDGAVDIQAMVQAKQPVLPLSLTIAQDDVVWVQLGHCAAGTQNCVAVPDNVRFGLAVHAAHGAQIVAQTLTRFTDTAGTGATTSMGEPAPAHSWVFARDRLDTTKTTTLALVNPLSTDVLVSVGLVHDGVVDRPAALQNVRVASGTRVTVTVVDEKTRTKVDAALVVDAPSTVAVERTVAGGDDVGRSVGISLG